MGKMIQFQGNSYCFFVGFSYIYIFTEITYIRYILWHSNDTLYHRHSEGKCGVLNSMQTILQLYLV